MAEYDYRLDGLLRALYERGCRNGEALLCPGAEFEAVRARKRRELAARMGIDRLAALACAKEPELLSERRQSGYTLRLYGMPILPDTVMPFYELAPDKPRLDANGRAIGALYCHGHGAGGVGDTLIEREPKGYHKNIPVELARRGYTVFMHEPAAFGDFNITVKHNMQGGPGCVPLTGHLLMYGITTVGLRIFQADCLAAYMRGRGVGSYAVMGISGGGTVASMYAAVDDNMAAAAITGYTNLFLTSILAIHHCIDNYIPDVMAVGEMPYLISLAYPKPLFISSGDKDPIFPLEGTQRAIDIIRGVYARRGGGDRVTGEIFDGAHEYSPKVIDWLDETL